MNWLKDCKKRSKKELLLKKRQIYFNNSWNKEESTLLLKVHREEEQTPTIAQKKKSYKICDKAFKRVNTFVDFRTDLVEGSSKRAGEELEQESTKKKDHKEGKNNYFQIIRADESSKMYLVFSQLLKSVDREDLVELYKLVKAKYGSTRPVEDMDLLLWGNLKTMFEPHVEDEIWKLQQMYKVLSWKLFDSVECIV
ncbi:hypothetical protein Tco_1531551 [Tanacetum coccineum]